MYRLTATKYSGEDTKINRHYKTIEGCLRFIHSKFTCPNEKFYNNGNGKDFFIYGNDRVWRIRYEEN